MSDLKPCAFCGGTPVIERFTRQAPHSFKVKCVTCQGRYVESRPRGKEEEAVAAWNDNRINDG